jgi:transcriptional regulator with PAS, ATPase and Fis domain
MSVFLRNFAVPYKAKKFMAKSPVQDIKQRYNIVGNCDELNRALDTALKIAPVDLSVLIIGENGVGKEIFPRIIHDHSSRKKKNYIAINCGAIPEGTIDSELFGHVEGAYTGAVGERKGYFETADGGTLFMDEVGELPAATQARLLRVLETGEYIPVGASQPRKTNVRIVAATNVNLEKAIADGRFRQDLYYRLNCVTIDVPPLRHRGEDILMLFRMFALNMFETHQIPPVRLTPESEQLLLAYSWPGNVRELRNIVTNMSITAEERTITPGILSRYLRRENHRGELEVVKKEEPSSGGQYEKDRAFILNMLLQLRSEVDELKRAYNTKALPSTYLPTKNEQRTGTASLTMKGEVIDAEGVEMCDAEEWAEEPVNEKVATTSTTINEMERELIRKSLEECHHHRKKAAEMLNISERTLYRKIKDYDLE